MTQSHQTLCSRLPFEPDSTPRPEPRATRAQSLLEYILFAVFGGALVFAPVALVLAKSTFHRSVPNMVSMGMAADRVNILTIVAPSGRSNVTSDALMLVSIKPSTRDIVVMSIPPDLWVRLGRHGTRRLGTGIGVGRSSGYPGGGKGLVADTVSELLRQPIHAVVELDYPALTRSIDGVGGIDVAVTRGVYDGRTRERFTRGVQHLSGARAVRYAFSRRMVGQANDRFAREARQRAVIAATLTSLSGVGTIPDLGRYTNLTREQVAWIAEAASTQPIRTATLAPYLDEFAVSTLLEDGQALRPRLGLSQLQKVAANLFQSSI